MSKRNKYIIYLDDVEPDDVGDAEGFQGVDIRWLITDGTMGTNHSTVFRVIFPPGAYHGPHYHTNTDEMVYTVRGRATQWVNGIECEMTPGSVLYIPKNTIHWQANYTDEDMENIGFYPDVPNYAASNQVLKDPSEWAKYGFTKKPEKK